MQNTTTQLDRVKETAITFLHIEPEPIEGFEIFVSHPILESSVTYLSTGKMFDIFEDTDSYEQWLKEMENIIRTRPTVDAVFMLIRKAYKLTFFKYVAEYLSDKDFGRLLRNAWTGVEFPSDNTNTSPKERILWFTKAKPEYLMDEEDYIKWKKLKNVFYVYRGCRNEESDIGMSWTLDKEKAKWFATRLADENDSPVIYTYQVNKKDVFAYFSDRDESEVVVNPNKILKQNLKIKSVY